MASTVPARTSPSKSPRKRSKPGPPVLRLSTASDPVVTHHEHLVAWFESTRGILEHLIGDCCAVLRAGGDHDHPLSKVMGSNNLKDLREVMRKSGGWDEEPLLGLKDLSRDAGSFAWVLDLFLDFCTSHQVGEAIESPASC